MRVTQITYGKSKKLRDGTFEFLILKADVDIIEDDFPQVIENVKDAVNRNLTREF
jgi:oligoribonuclease NrnB/cAMP/cGMP phosphodiesterase (DHH superfamily)